MCSTSDFHQARKQSPEDSSSRLRLRRRVPKTRSCCTRTLRGTPTRPKDSNTVTLLTDLLPLSLRHPLLPTQPQPWTLTRKEAHPLRPQSPKSVPNPQTAPKRRRGNPRPESPNFLGLSEIFYKPFRLTSNKRRVINPRGARRSVIYEDWVDWKGTLTLF